MTDSRSELQDDNGWCKPRHEAVDVKLFTEKKEDDFVTVYQAAVNSCYCKQVGLS